MSDKKLFQQKMQAQLDEWRAEIDKLKARASRAGADAQIKMNKQIQALEIKIDEGKKKLSQLTEAADDAWESIKGSVESSWRSLKSAVNDAVAKFKE